MQVIGVIDLARGVAVHARRGMRGTYRPVGTAAGCTINGDPLALARTYIDRFGITELYAADLDAIADVERTSANGSGATTPPIAHDVILTQLAGSAALWLDAGISTLLHAKRALAVGSARVVVGLETLDSFDMLSAACDELGSEHVAFSLDLRDGMPVAPRFHDPPLDVAALAEQAEAAGAGALIVLDLARVGSSLGPDIATIETVRHAAPNTALIAGGGVRGLEDLIQLADAGCDGVLLATALHEGHIGAEELRRLRHASDSR